MDAREVVVVGGGAAGIFAAIACAEKAPGAVVTVLEKSARFLAKVAISGGGRCNVTHSCFDAREFAAHFPRGRRELIGPFRRFQARDTVEWFEARGVGLKVEDDGRIFPVTDKSRTIVDCLLGAATSAGVGLLANRAVEHVKPLHTGRPAGALPPRFELALSDGGAMTCNRLLLATGGCRTAAGGSLAVSLGHRLAAPVPSLFTFRVEAPWLSGLAGVSLGQAEVSVPGTRLRERGALLVTHSGLSGPAILRLSAFGARLLHGLEYRFPLHVNWLPQFGAEDLAAALSACRREHATRRVTNTPIPPVPLRLWRQLALAAGVERDTRWSRFSRSDQHRLALQLSRTELPVSGKSLYKEEFVTCGGVRLSEVAFATMESRICPGLYFAGELLDFDGVTGGFNFQAAWTTGWIAGRALAGP